MLDTLLQKTSPQSDEAKTQRKAFVLLILVGLLSAFFDGWFDPPDDGGWHIGTAIISLFGSVSGVICIFLTYRGRVHLSGWALIIVLAVAVSTIFITGTSSSVLITLTGVFCLVMVLPPNILPDQNVITSRLWPATFITLYIVFFSLRIVLRDGDVISYPSETPYLFFSGPVLIYLIHSMSKNTSLRLQTANQQSRLALAEVDLVNSRLWERSVELSEALEVANLASEAKGQFLANMSHELRTPLNAILGYAEIVKEDLDDLEPGELLPENLSEDLKHIETAGKHLLSLISDVLDLARIEAGQSVVDIETVSVKKLFDEFEVVMKPQLMKRNNTLNIELEHSLVLQTDHVKLRQILFNLLGNAAKFTDHGTITLRAIPVKGSHILFEVSDTGKGIAKEKQARLFDPFEQADSSSTREHGGAGLGLALCAQLVELLGGQIALESEGEGKGSTFLFTLPLTPEQYSASTSTSQTEPETQPQHGERS